MANFGNNQAKGNKLNPDICEIVKRWQNWSNFTIGIFPFVIENFDQSSFVPLFNFSEFLLFFTKQ